MSDYTVLAERAQALLATAERIISGGRPGDGLARAEAMVNAAAVYATLAEMARQAETAEDAAPAE